MGDGEMLIVLMFVESERRKNLNSIVFPDIATGYIPSKWVI